MLTKQFLLSSQLIRYSFTRSSIFSRTFSPDKVRLFSAQAESSSIQNETPILGPLEVSPKIKTIVEQIEKLTLLEVSELNQELKKKLNIPDAPMMAFAGAMPAAAAKTNTEEEVVSKSVQTAFTVKLTKFDDGKKVALIKEVKGLVEGLNLVQAKKFVESVPQVIKNNLSKDEAEKLKSALEAAGGVCVIE